jgi:hypothetical protein
VRLINRNNLAVLRNGAKLFDMQVFVKAANEVFPGSRFGAESFAELRVLVNEYFQRLNS